MGRGMSSLRLPFTVRAPRSRRSAADWVRLTATSAFSVLREREPAPLVERVVADATKFLEASVVRPLPVGPLGHLAPTTADELPEPARRMEDALLARALAEERSLLSSHPKLDPALTGLARSCAAAGVTTHVLLARAFGETHGAFATHWIGRERPPHEQRVGFYYYWDYVGLAIAALAERTRIEAELEELRAQAFIDRLTGLANGVALDRELQRHGETVPFSVLVLDFDGLRDANEQLGYERGGNVLIRAVGRALGELCSEHEFPARVHTAGDEFAVLLPQVDEEGAAARARQVEAALDAVDLLEPHRAVYRGASVGAATRRPGEAPGQTLGRAVDAMRERKRVRRGA